MFVDVSDGVSVPVSSLLPPVSPGPGVTLVVPQMLLQTPLISESFVLPAEPTEILELGGVACPVLHPQVFLHLSVSAAQRVPATLETGHGPEPLSLRDDDQGLRLVGSHTVLLLHVSHSIALKGENLRTVPTLECLLHVVLLHMRLQTILLQQFIAVRTLDLLGVSLNRKSLFILMAL